jgi:1,4-alpha-glucan branching enzyme
MKTALRDRGDTTPTLLGDVDLHLFNEGTHRRLHDHLGAHPGRFGGRDGVYFAVWAPHAEWVEVFGSWDGWKGGARLSARGATGVHEGFVAGVEPGHGYKFRIRSREGGAPFEKADPLAFRTEEPPATASVVWKQDYSWGDQEWMARRRGKIGRHAPVSIYEVHLGSWRRGDGNRRLSYRELAPMLADHCERLGFTHVELLPVMEHPFYGSWGYQVTAYFGPSARQGSPEDVMFLVDTLHRRGIGVIFDWVPGHFPMDAHGLYRFDGSALYEHVDVRQGFHPEWTSAIFNYGRNEVRSFLLSSAYCWLERFHGDGLRVDGVASMLYLDYARKDGEWVPNKYGGKENLEAVSFLRQLNESVYRDHPEVEIIAEESTAWPGVSRPLYVGGLGFGYKWDMGWMHDTLRYLGRDPIYRHHHHNELTFRGLYQFHENYVLPLSHDEVVHGKGSLLGKMAGDAWQKRANLRLLLAHQYTQPGKKMLFMGGEIGQWREWNHEASLDWHLMDDPRHAGIALLVGELNRLYRLPALHHHDCEPEGFAWIDANDAGQSVITYERRGGVRDVAVVALNLTPVPRHNYRIGVARAGFWKEALNTDAVEFGGSGMGNAGGMEAAPVPAHGRPLSLNVTLPPLAALIFVPGGP